MSFWSGKKSISLCVRGIKNTEKNGYVALDPAEDWLENWIKFFVVVVVWWCCQSITVIKCSYGDENKFKWSSYDDIWMGKATIPQWPFIYCLHHTHACDSWMW